MEATSLHPLAATPHPDPLPERDRLKTLRPAIETPKKYGRSVNRRVVHPTKKMHVQVTLLDRPLPPGEGWGEGLVKSTSSLSTSLIVVSVERIEGVLLSDETSGHEATARPSPRQSFDSRAGNGRGQRLRHASRACGNVTLTTERLVAAAPHPDPLPEGEGLEIGRYACDTEGVIEGSQGCACQQNRT